MATKLTGFSKFLIVALVLGLLFFAGNWIMKNTGLGDQIADKTETVTKTAKNEVKDIAKVKHNDLNKSDAKHSTSSDAKHSSQKGGSFDFTPAKPVGGKLMGVVELGASGFNSFIINKDRDDNWEKREYEWGNSLVVDGMASDADIRNGLKNYISKILDYGVSGKDIHFVVSSGAKKEELLKPIIANLKKMGYVVNEVTPQQEGQYALKAALPKDFYRKAFTVDIGSGNTKISWVNNGNVEAVESIGAKYYKKSISDSQAYNEAKTNAEKVPHHLAKTSFIIGGVPYNLAKAVRNGNERYTILDHPANYSKLAEEKGKKVQSGLNIYQGIIDGSGCEKFIFDWDANFTIGFLLSLPN